MSVDWLTYSERCKKDLEFQTKMNVGPDLPITGVCVVSDPAQCPPNYTLVDKTYDRPEDADLWKDGFFGRRVMRYMCVERQVPTQSQDVLVDVALINDRDPIPVGFSVVEFTHDTREKATKKKQLCVRWMVPSLTQDAITELIFLTRAQRRAPAGYTLIGELNNMSLCYKMGKLGAAGAGCGGSAGGMPLSSSTPAGMAYSGSSSGSLPYAISPGVGAALSAPPPVPPRPPASAGGPTPLSRSMSRTGGGTVHALSGIEWKLNPKFRSLLDLNDVSIPYTRGKTLMQIETEYGYDFTVEQSVSRTALMS